MTVPAMTSRAVVEASQPARPATAGRMRSSLKTVIRVPFLRPVPGVLVGSGCRVKLDRYRLLHFCLISPCYMEYLSKIINYYPHR
jgi:hypothetical protein